MEATLTINGLSDLIEVVKELNANIVAMGKVDVQVVPPKSAKKPTKAAPIEESEDDEAEDEELTHEDVIEALQTHSEENGRESAMKILKKLGVKKVKELKPNQLARALELAKG